jgi:hypothetical protein
VKINFSGTMEEFETLFGTRATTYNVQWRMADAASLPETEYPDVTTMQAPDVSLTPGTWIGDPDPQTGPVKDVADKPKRAPRAPREAKATSPAEEFVKNTPVEQKDEEPPLTEAYVRSKVIEAMKADRDKGRAVLKRFTETDFAGVKPEDWPELLKGLAE